MKKRFPKFNKAYLLVITGCMFAGKTDLLIKTIQEIEHQNGPVLKLKPSVDGRSQGFFYSRTKKKIVALSVANAKAAQKQFNKHLLKQPKLAAVAFDETQFFQPNLIGVIKTILKAGKIVVCSGLDKGFSDRNLPVMNQLRAMAHDEIVLKAICSLCNKAAMKTQRVDSAGAAVFCSPNDPTKLVGGSELYQARCEKCFQAFPEQPTNLKLNRNQTNLFEDNSVAMNFGLSAKSVSKWTKGK